MIRIPWSQIVEEQFKRAFIVSDLHLGGADERFQMFSSGPEFKELCEHIRINTDPEENPTLLLINGDFVDFLAEDGAKYWNGACAAANLESMSQRDEFEPVFAGLRRLASKSGMKIVIVLGNHDLELAMPDTKAKFIELIAGDNDARKARIEFCFDGNGYRFRVGSARALATHGNEVDKFNFTRFDTLQQIIRERALEGTSPTESRWKPSAGTVFVIDAINDIKKQYPFVDLLKPEAVTFLTLVILAPKHLTVADEFAALMATAAFNEHKRPDSERRFLEFDPRGATPTSSAQAIELKAHNHVRNPNLDADQLIYRSDSEFLGITDWVDSARSAVNELVESGIELAHETSNWVKNELTDAKRAAHVKILQQSLRPLVAKEQPSVRQLGDPDEKLLGIVRQNYDVVFAGHTHARRFCELESSHVKYYVNTGTWAGLMRIGEADVTSSRSMNRLYDVLVSGERGEIQKSPWFKNECPVAVMEQTNDGSTSLKLVRVDSEKRLANEFENGQTYGVKLSDAKLGDDA